MDKNELRRALQHALTVADANTVWADGAPIVAALAPFERAAITGYHAHVVRILSEPCDMEWVDKWYLSEHPWQQKPAKDRV